MDSKNIFAVYGPPTSVVSLKNGVKIAGSAEPLKMGQYGTMPQRMAIDAQKAGHVRLEAKPVSVPESVKVK